MIGGRVWAWVLSLATLAYVWLAVDVGAAWAWTAVVHEDGRRTLTETTFYARHFLREVPVAVFYVAALVCSAGIRVDWAVLRRGRIPLFVAGVAVVAAWVWVVDRHGLGVAGSDLGQFSIRDDEGWRGAHWGGHYLSNLVFFGCAWSLGAPSRRRRVQNATPVVVLLLGLCSIVLVAEPGQAIFSPRATAHQVREIATHLAITMPLGFFALRLPSLALPTFPTPVPILVVLVSGGLFVAAGAGGALEQVAAAPSSRVAAHLFEHALDVALVVLLCVGLRSSESRT